MKIVQREERTISGFSIRTTNANEMSPDTAKIGTLHQYFDINTTVDYELGARLYGVYFDYESDASGEFSVLSGADKVDSSTETLEQVILAAGEYMIFEAKGEMPQVVIETWMKVWDYFSDENSPHQRAYTTDFEFYKSQDEVEVYISIK